MRINKKDKELYQGVILLVLTVLAGSYMCYVSLKSGEPLWLSIVGGLIAAFITLFCGGMITSCE